MTSTVSVMRMAQDDFLFLLGLCMKDDNGKPLWNTCPIEDVYRAKDYLGVSRDTRTKCVGVRWSKNKVVYCVDDSRTVEIVPDRDVMSVYALLNAIQTYLDRVESVNKGDFTDVINGCGLDSSQITFEGSNGLYHVKDICDLSGLDVSVNLNNWDSVEKCGQYGGVVYIVNG